MISVVSEDKRVGVMRRMRWLLCGLAFIGVAQQAQAADLPDDFLRGSSTVVDTGGYLPWAGTYIGGQFGGAASGTDFSGATRSLVAFLLRNTTIENENHVSNWTTLGKGDTTGMSYGGFVGFNMQWDAAVLGIEANYNRTSLTMSANDTMRRLFATSDGYNNDVLVDAASSIHITDYGTLRVRGGWAAGNFMPYAFVGFALGRADVTNSARVIAQGTSTSGRPPYFSDTTAAVTRTGDLAYGFATGLGVDFALMQNIFVRAEYEYVQFGEFNDLKTHIHTARIGGGIKF
jgi:outer membrane immunogenic protein